MSAATVALRHEFLRRFPEEAARVLERHEPETSARTLAGESDNCIAQVVRRLAPEHAALVLKRGDEAFSQRLMNALDPARLAGLLARLDEDERATRLALLSKGLAREIESLLRHPPNSAGFLMDARFLTVRPEVTVAEVLDSIRGAGRRLTDVMVTDDDGRLAGIVRLDAIVGGAPDERLSAHLMPEPLRVRPETNRDEVVELLNKYRVTTLPVVDHEDRLVGVIRHDALVLAAQRELLSDLQRMVGAGSEERALSSPWLAIRTRLPWLNINLLTAFAAASVVGLFEDTIARFTALAVLLPVVAGQSGNTGAQAMAVTMRGLALREVRPSQWFRVVRKELVGGLVNGTSIAFVTALAVFIWSGSTGLALVMALGMVFSMVIAACSGAVVPMVLSALGRDPATASSIILTTVTDIAGFFSFLGLATVLASLLEAG